MARIGRTVLWAAGLVLALSMTASSLSAQRGGPPKNQMVQAAERSIGLALLQSDPATRESHLRTALQSALDALAANNQDAAGWFFAGQAYAGLGDMVGADTAFAHAERLFPGYAEEIAAHRESAWIDAYNAAVTAYQEDDLAGSIRHFEAAHRIYKGRPEAAVILGRLYMQENRFDDAAEVFRSALEITKAGPPAQLDSAGVAEWNESFKDAAFGLGEVMSGLGRHAEAVEAYRAYNERYPDDANGIARLASALAAAGQVEEASRITDRLLARSDLDEQQLFEIGIGFFNAEEYRGAAAVFGRATEVNPYSRDAVYNYAQSLFLQARRIEEATESPDPAQVQELMEIYRKLDEAAAKVREFDPNNLDALRLQAQGMHGLSRHGGDEVAQQLRDRSTKLVQDFEAFPFEVVDLQLSVDGNTIQLNGTFQNLRVEQGKQVRLRFTILGDGGATLASETVAVTAPAPEQSTPFGVALRLTSGTFRGWKYEVVDGV
ncbi:MAG TPA: tetratricopeptide repeat protein [Longimicrobiales bacterium]|nr:tetratricopeptide repeat protein [Longimicrobiales bacterium]